MPPAIAAAIVTAAGLTGTIATIATFALSTVLTIGFSLLQSALVGKPKTPRASQERRFTVRSAQAPRQVVYGQTRVKDPVLIASFETDNNTYLHLMLAFAGHECEAVDEIYFNDELVGARDSNGNVTEGTFANFARIRAHLGADDQEADALAVAEIDDWTASDRGRGICYLYVRLKHSLKVYPGGIPNIEAVIRGKRVRSFQTGVTAWSNNAALCAYDYFRDATYGFAAPLATIAAEAATDEAVADEIVGVVETEFACTSAEDGLVTLATPGLRLGDRIVFDAPAPSGLAAGQNYHWIRRSATTGLVATSLANARAGVGVRFNADGTGHTLTRKGQLRYACNGSFLSDENRLDVLEELVGAMAGLPLPHAAGYRLRAGFDPTPESEGLTRDMLRGQVRITTFRRRQDLYNAVQGTFVSADENHARTDFPAVTAAVFVAQDGGDALPREVELAFTDDSEAAQRLALIDLAQSRQQIVVEWPGTLDCIKFQQGDVVPITLAEMGWEGKLFRVARDGFGSEWPGYSLTLVEYAAGIYDATLSEIVAYDPAPNTTLSAGFVAPPAGISYQIQTVDTSGGQAIYEFQVTGSPSPDARVSGYRVEMKKSSDPDFENAIVVIGPAFPIRIGPIDGTTEYDLRMAALIHAGAISEFVETAAADAGGGDGVAPSAPTGLANTQEVMSVDPLTRLPIKNETVAFTGGSLNAKGTAAAGKGSVVVEGEGDEGVEVYSIEITTAGRGYAGTPTASGVNSGATGTVNMGNPTKAHLVWTDPGDADLQRIDILRGPDSNSANATVVANALAGAEIASPLLTVSAGSSQWFFLQAVDRAGNRSAITAGVEVTRTAT